MIVKRRGDRIIITMSLSLRTIIIIIINEEWIGSDDTNIIATQ